MNPKKGNKAAKAQEGSLSKNQSQAKANQNQSQGKDQGGKAP